MRMHTDNRHQYNFSFQIKFYLPFSRSDYQSLTTLCHPACSNSNTCDDTATVYQYWSVDLPQSTFQAVKKGTLCTPVLVHREFEVDMKGKTFLLNGFTQLLNIFDHTHWSVM